MSKAKKEKEKYKVVLYNETTLHEVRSFRVSVLNIIAYAGLLIIVVAALVSVLFVFTPLNRFIPRQEEEKYHDELIESALKIDSIMSVLDQRNEYFLSIRKIISGNPDTGLPAADTVLERQRVDFAKSKHDSILQTLIELEEQQSLAVITGTPRERDRNMTFFMPVKGTVTQSFDYNSGHLGVDIAAKDGEPVLSTLPGTVILATWSSETGNVIQVQHSNNFVSIYKHNSALLKKVGDKVEAGEAIAIIGNSGELTTGTHLHFELWYNGTAVNPENFIAY